ncbi:hypothetical protein [Duganella violaceipulchra]|uniref:Uncharacterized protein n=1 Tax=Duganella violaceipulchra TaxID=2849652 RepID=A0AA41HDB3_9BURK|nr:hypothetical protein [Duganella violaceicalia]MBV6322444.1 hypothetical protein [Duganella violaceicalia]MCP2010649.1 hypothetical protein [Duganella violaceicalia]
MHDTVAYRRAAAAEAMEIENLYLDGILDAQPAPATQSMLVDGCQPAHRLTVMGVKKIQGELSQQTTVRCSAAIEDSFLASVR